MVSTLLFLAALDAGAAATLSTPAPATDPASLRDAKLILADYAKAIGDESAWKKHKSVRLRREVSVKSMSFTSVEETHLARGGRIFSTSEMPGMGSFRRGCDGHTAWAEDPINGLRVLKDAEAEDVRIAALWNSEWRLGEAYKKVLSVPPPASAPKGQALECVELSKGKGQPTVLCFDRATHLRAWEQGVQASQGGDVPYVTRFSDWRVVDGVKVWFREDVTVGPVTMEGRTLEIVFDEPPKAGMFALPKKTMSAQ